MFLITNKHFNFTDFWIRNSIFLLAPPPGGSTHLLSIWLVDRWWWDRCSVQSPAKKSLSCQVTEPLAAPPGSDAELQVWRVEDPDAALWRLSLLWLYLFSLVLFSLTENGLIVERAARRRPVFFPESFVQRKMWFFFYHRKTCGGSMGLFCECWGNSDVAMAGCYRVTFYSDFVCIKTWWMNLNCLIC